MIPSVGQSYLQAERRVSSGSPGSTGLALSFSRSQLYEEQRPAPFPMPSGVSCLSFQIVCPLALRCESVAEAKMTGAISVSQFDVKHAGGRKFTFKLNFGYIPIVQSPERVTVCVRESMCVYIQIRYSLKLTVTRVLILVLV